MDTIQKIKKLAEEKRFSILELERVSGLGRNRFQKLTPNNIRLAEVQLIAVALDVSVGELLGESIAELNAEELLFLRQARRLGMAEAWDRLMLNPRHADHPTKKPLSVIGEVELKAQLERQNKRTNSHQPPLAGDKSTSPDVPSPPTRRNPDQV